MFNSDDDKLSSNELRTSLQRKGSGKVTGKGIHCNVADARKNAYDVLSLCVFVCIIFFKSGANYCNGKETLFMVMCEGEDCPVGWWHYECAGFTDEPTMDHWFCKYCV